MHDLGQEVKSLNTAVLRIEVCFNRAVTTQQMQHLKAPWHRNFCLCHIFVLNISVTVLRMLISLLWYSQGQRKKVWFFPPLFPRQSYVFVTHRPQAICEVLTELCTVSLVALKGRENIIKLETPKTREKVSYSEWTKVPACSAPPPTEAFLLNTFLNVTWVTVILHFRRISDNCGSKPIFLDCHSCCFVCLFVFPLNIVKRI